MMDAPFPPAAAQGKAANNCWSTIGVRGDKSCAALAQHAHCRNCPTYSEIAAMLLTRDVAHDSQVDWEARYAAPRKQGEQSVRSVLIFRIGTEWFAIPTAALDEVLELRAVHRLPHRNNPVVKGVTNVRGELVVCVSLSRLLGIETDGDQVERVRRLLILRADGGRFALPVDEVQQTHSYQSDEVIVPPATSAQSARSFTTGMIAWRDRMVSCLDAAQLVRSFESALG